MDNWIRKIKWLNPWFRLRACRNEMREYIEQGGRLEVEVELWKKEAHTQKIYNVSFAHWLFEIGAFQRTTGHYGFPGYNRPYTIQEMYQLFLQGLQQTQPSPPNTTIK